MKQVGFSEHVTVFPAPPTSIAVIATTNKDIDNNVMSDVKRSLLDMSPGGKTDDADEEPDDHVESNETFAEFCTRQAQNVVHFLVEDWFLSALLGIITAVLSVGMDVAIEVLQHAHVTFYDKMLAISSYLAFSQWVAHIVILTMFAAIFCQIVSKQAVGSGIPEVKVIMHGFKMENYLTTRTLVAKMVGLTLAMGGGLPIGKEGPFVHMGAIVATLLSKITSACQYSAFFSNEGREMEMLSSGCAVGIACTFSAPIGAVLYAIESTSKYFAVKNYWRGFLAATCSAIVFRCANFFVTAEQSGTITAFYQTRFPTDCFLVEELPIFLLLGFISGLMGSFFIFIHRQISIFRSKNRVYKLIFRNNFLAFTVFMAFVVGVLTFPNGLGRYFAGRLTFRETMADFFNNCTWVSNDSRRCPDTILTHWTGGSEGDVSIFTSLVLYYILYFVLVAICISINVPAGVFVPSFIIGAAGGRLMGETMVVLFPEGMRGPGGPPIHPGLYAVVGAAAYTGAVTHTLSVSVIICELTGQLSPILPVLIAMLMGNAVCKFLQPSIYESIIRVKKYPYLPDLPPSRVSVHTVKVEQLMVTDVIYITKDMTYREMKEILQLAPHLRSFPIVTDHENKILLGSVAKRYLTMLLRRHVLVNQQDSRNIGRMTPSEIFNTIRRTSMRLSRRSPSRRSNSSQTRENSVPETARSDAPSDQVEFVSERTISGNTLLSISPLHCPNNIPLQAVFTRPSSADLSKTETNADILLNRNIDLDEIAIDAAPFQLVLGSSLYKVHTLFSLLGLSHAYVTDCGKLVGVVGLKELRDAMANIYVRGAVAPVKPDRKLTSGTFLDMSHMNKDKLLNTPQTPPANGLSINMESPKFGNSLTVPPMAL
ncbi:Chloride channel protein [Caenorhabditis elegans]|uniref:Chloride channel protein n=2 Tax=Caenorhabditis elegans TaxID=6239 RepID=G5EG93_CAEEL|nr:Chloride channel protein [Caenorhabditis elegans]CAA90092.2 Chloride channel protein [Caenorhabditis elegans]